MYRLAPLGLIFAAHGAAGFELDTLLPPGIPGFGAAPGVTILSRLHPDYAPLEISAGGLEFSPALSAGAGYDTAPNGAAPGACVLNLNPSVLAADPQLGFGAYAAATVAAYPGEPTQNSSGYTVALGERAVLPSQTPTLAFARLYGQETGFGLNNLPFSRPVAFNVTLLRGADAFTSGMFTITPELSGALTQFPTLPEEDRADVRQALDLGFSDGGPLKLVGRLQATESRYRATAFNANDFEALAGVEDNAEGIWDFRLLAGVAARQPATGRPLIAPVVEAASDWMPDGLDSFSLSLAHEIDNPGQETAAGYTLTQGKLGWDHEYLRNVIISGSAQIAHAAYFQGGLIETIFNAEAGINWHFNRAMALGAAYAFNDRQANFLAAANEHAVTLTLTWTP
jgi:hypothetical protein